MRHADVGRASSPKSSAWRSRIGREALQNAFHHSGARAINVQLVHGDDEFRMRVQDDGRGIDPRTLENGSRPGHWGLPSMLERARQMGAQLDIRMRPGGGTMIELTIPAALAYQDLAPHSRWLRRWRVLGIRPST